MLVAGATVDPVKDHLQQVGRVPLLTAEQEVELATQIEAGLLAAQRLSSDAVLDPAMRRDLERIAADGRRAKDHMTQDAQCARARGFAPCSSPRSLAAAPGP